MGVEMNVMVKVTGGHGLGFQDCLPWKFWGAVEPGLWSYPLYLSSSAGRLFGLGDGMPVILIWEAFFLSTSLHNYSSQGERGMGGQRRSVWPGPQFSQAWEPCPRRLRQCREWRLAWPEAVLGRGRSRAQSIHNTGSGTVAHSTLPFAFGLPAPSQASAHPPLGTASHAIHLEGPSPTQPPF